MSRSIHTPWIITLILCLGLFSASNSMAANTADVDPATLLQQLQSGQPLLIIDVRTPQEYREGHVPTAINIPHTEMSVRLKEISTHKQQPVILYCKSGRRSALATDTLRQAGFTQLLHLKGDMDGWKRKEYPQDH